MAILPFIVQMIYMEHNCSYSPGFGDVVLMLEHVGRMCSHMGRSVTSTLQSKALNSLSPINNNHNDKDQTISIKL